MSYNIKDVDFYSIFIEYKLAKYLVNYYIHSLGWTEEAALIYAIGLFHNDTIRQIKLFGKDGEEI